MIQAHMKINHVIAFYISVYHVLMKAFMTEITFVTPVAPFTNMV